MRTSEDLFNLIKSLNKSEKGYFKKYTSMHVIGQKNNYMKLFEETDKQKKYDEQKIRNAFKGEKFTNQLSVVKNYLYNLILKSLEAYHSDIDSQLRSSLRHAYILYEKNLYSQCKKILKMVKQLGYKYGKHNILLEIIELEKQIARKESYLGKTDKDIAAVHVEERKLLKDILTERKLESLDSRICLLFLREGLVRNKKTLKKYQEIIKKLSLKKEKDLPFKARTSLYHAKSFYYLVKGDHENYMKYSERNFSYMELFPFQQELHYQDYMIAISNYGIAAIGLRKYGDATKAIEKLKLVQEKLFLNKTDQKKYELPLFKYMFFLEIKLYIDTGEFEKGVLLIPSIEKGLDQFQGALGKYNETVFTYYIFYLYFGQRQYTEALKWLNKLQDSPDGEIIADYYYFSRILQLILHYEIGNKDYLEYLIRSVYRFLYKRQKIHKFETAILDFIRKLPYVSIEKDLVDVFKQLRMELVNLFKNPFEKKVFGYFDFISWIESKIEKKSFIEIVKLKANNSNC